jgi:hypothetical protein
MSLNIYFVSTPLNRSEDHFKYMGYDTYDSFVVCAKTEKEARVTHPVIADAIYDYDAQLWKHKRGKEWDNCGSEIRNLYGWVHGKDVDKLLVEHIGIALDSMVPGIVLASFNAG